MIADAETYRRALRYAEVACRLEPENGLFLNTLGVARYRCGKYQEAAQTLLRSDQLNRKRGRPQSGDLAFLAMVYHRLGQDKEARTYLDQLRQRVKDNQSQENQDFLKEVEALLNAVGPSKR